MNEDLSALPSMCIPLVSFTSAQWHAWRILQERYRQDRDILEADERARLAFLKWLLETGRLVQ